MLVASQKRGESTIGKHARPESSVDREWHIPGALSIWRGQATLEGWDPAVMAALREAGVTVVRITRWPDTDLTSLAEVADRITELHLECDVQDLSALQQFRNLERLGIRSGVDAVDWSRLARLRHLSVWPGAESLGNLARCPDLQSLQVTDGRLASLEELAGLTSLEELLVFEAPLASLAGIEALPSLRRLVLQQVPLKSLDGVQRAAALEEVYLEMLPRLGSAAGVEQLPRLTGATIGACRRIRDLDRLGAARGLKELAIARQPLSEPGFIRELRDLKSLRLEDVGRLPSLAFLKPLHALVALDLGGGTTVEDGDLSLLLNLPALREVSFQDRRHYAEKQEHVMQVLLARGTWGPGPFENERAVRWAEELSRHTDPRDPLRVVGFTVAAIPNLGGAVRSRTRRSVPAAIGQVGIAAAEVLASLNNQTGNRLVGSDAADKWVRAHRGMSIPAELMALAQQAMERVAQAPSGLRELWEERGGLSEWLQVVADLRSRLAE